MAETTSEPALTSHSRRRILLVLSDPDESRRILESLGDMRSKWDAESVADMSGAMAKVRQTAYDAVIVDLLPPGGAGVGLLQQILEISPDTLRLGLTTGAERQAIHEVGAPAHQLLTAPCEPNALKAVLARAFASQELVNQDPIKKLIAGIHALPVLPRVYTELMQELKSDEPSLERAGQIVTRDMGLSAKILQLVNSAFFGLSRPVAHPSEAAMFLGCETLEALVLSLQVFSQFHPLKLAEFSVENLWKHSWTTGVLARRLCELEEASRLVTDEAFLAGLLHDVGKLVLAANYPERLEENTRRARQQNIPLWEEERRSWGASHAELGGYLLGLWGLPAAVIDAVAFHHQPALARQETFSALTAVHVANTLGKLHPNLCNLPQQTVDLDYLRSLGLAGRVDGWKQCFKEAAEKR